MKARAKRAPTARELMVATAAREIRDGELVFVGMRLPLLAFMLAQATHAQSAVGLYENGVIRARAARSLLYTMSDPANIEGATRTGEMLEVMGLLQSGRVGLGFVGAAEVDRFGNLNTTRVESARLSGSGGACDIASMSARLAVLLKHTRRPARRKSSLRNLTGLRRWPRLARLGRPRSGRAVRGHHGSRRPSIRPRDEKSRARLVPPAHRRELARARRRRDRMGRSASIPTVVLPSFRARTSSISYGLSIRKVFGWEHHDAPATR